MRGCLSAEFSKTTHAHLAARNKCGEVVAMRAGGVAEQVCGVPEQGPAERSTT